jgi:acetolactate synthase-1/2/3 large subunit
LKNLNVKFDLKIYSDLCYFVDYLLKEKILKKKNNWENLKNFKEKNWYQPKITSRPNSDFFIRTLTKKIKDNFCLVIDGGGTALYSGFQSLFVKDFDRVICSSAISSMGTGLAETIGVSKSKKYKKIVCVIGDGSFLMNIQDLQNIKQDQINVIIVLVNNNGYLAIRNTQNEFLKKRFYGTHPDWNLKMPNFSKIIKSFGLKYIKIDTSTNLEKKIELIKNMQGPIVCELFVNENQPSLFKQGYKQIKKNKFQPQSLFEMFPFINKPISNTNN